MTPDPAAVVAGLFSAAAVFLVVSIAWRGASSTRHDARQDALLLPWALAIAVLWHPGLVRGLAASRDGDAFLALPPGGRAGLAAVVLVAGLVPFVLSVVKTRALRRAFVRRATLVPGAADLALTVALALAALALATPPLHAGYKRLFPEPLAPRAADGPPSGVPLAELAFPTASGSLAAHAAALFLWTLAIAVLLGWLLDVRRRRRPLGALQAGSAVGALAALWWLASLAVR